MSLLFTLALHVAVLTSVAPSVPPSSEPAAAASVEAPDGALADLDAIYAEHHAGRTGAGAYMVPLDVALCGCCADVCLDVCVRDIDNACFDGRLRPALSLIMLWATFGAVIGMVGGCAIGLIPAVIFGVISYQASLANGASDYDAGNAALSSFALTDGLAANAGLCAGGAVGGVVGLFMGADLLAGPPNDAPPQQDRRRRRGEDRSEAFDDEVPPQNPSPAYDDEEPPGDAPPPPSVRF